MKMREAQVGRVGRGRVVSGERDGESVGNLTSKNKGNIICIPSRSEGVTVSVRIISIIE